MICHADVIPQNTPFSAVVCGVQGSGKSHTVSIILESMLVPQYTPIGSLKQPLSGLVLHYSNGGPNGLPSEAAYIGRSTGITIKTPKVHVYVPKSSLGTRKRVYAPLGANVTVAPLLFDESELDAEAFLTMMAIDSLESAPLYMQIVMVCLLSFILDSSMNAETSCSPFFGTLVKRSLLTGSKQNSKYEKKALTLHNLPGWNKGWRYLKRSCCRGADNNRALLLVV